MAHIPKYPDEAAFPQPRQESLPSDVAALTLLPAQWGLTKRELFAAMAMQGMLASETEASNYGHIVFLAESAVKRADALLAELAK